MAFQRTCGPWFFERPYEKRSSRTFLRIRSQNGGVVASGYCVFDSDGQTDYCVMRTAREAIAKATGGKA